jgi:hypothetical protein
VSKKQSNPKRDRIVAISPALVGVLVIGLIVGLQQVDIVFALIILGAFVVAVLPPILVVLKLTPDDSQ